MILRKNYLQLGNLLSVFVDEKEGRSWSRKV